MEIHIRTLVFVVVSLAGSIALPFLVSLLPADHIQVTASMQALPTPTPVPLRGLTASSHALAQALLRSTPPAEGNLLPTPLPAAVVATVRTDGANLNIRSGPGLDHPVIGSAPNGRVLSVTGLSADGEWLQIAIPDFARQGWVFAGLTEVDGDLATLPQVRE